MWWLVEMCIVPVALDDLDRYIESLTRSFYVLRLALEAGTKCHD
jgi:hypothetical protein